MKVSIIAAGAALFIGATANAQVVIVADVPTQHVSFADLNLNSRAGLDTLRSRIRGAARIVCGDSFAEVPVKDRIATRACVSRAVADGDRQMASALTRSGSSTTLAAATLTIRAR